MKRTYEDEWLPQALAIGVTYEQFWRMNPRLLKIYTKAYKIKQEEQNAMAHLQGIYIRDALLSVVGNMFKAKGTKNFEYPNKPYGLTEKTETLTEDDKQAQVNQLFANLQLMKERFDANRKSN